MSKRKNTGRDIEFFISSWGLHEFDDETQTTTTYVPNCPYRTVNGHPLDIDVMATLLTPGMISELLEMGQSNNPVEDIESMSERYGVEPFVFAELARRSSDLFEEDYAEFLETIVSMSYATWFGLVMQHSDKDAYIHKCWGDAFCKMSDLHSFTVIEKGSKQIMIDRGVIKRMKDGRYTVSYNFMKMDMGRYLNGGEVMM